MFECISRKLFNPCIGHKEPKPQKIGFWDKIRNAIYNLLPSWEKKKISYIQRLKKAKPVVKPVKIKAKKVEKTSDPSLEGFRRVVRSKVEDLVIVAKSQVKTRLLAEFLEKDIDQVTCAVTERLALLFEKMDYTALMHDVLNEVNEHAEVIRLGKEGEIEVPQTGKTLLDILFPEGIAVLLGDEKLELKDKLAPQLEIVVSQAIHELTAIDKKANSEIVSVNGKVATLKDKNGKEVDCFMKAPLMVNLGKGKVIDVSGEEHAVEGEITIVEGCWQGKKIAKVLIEEGKATAKDVEIDPEEIVAHPFEEIFVLFGFPIIEKLLIWAMVDKELQGKQICAEEIEGATNKLVEKIYPKIKDFLGRNSLEFRDLIKERLILRPQKLGQKCQNEELFGKVIDNFLKIGGARWGLGWFKNLVSQLVSTKAAPLHQSHRFLVNKIVENVEKVSVGKELNKEHGHIPADDERNIFKKKLHNVCQILKKEFFLPVDVESRAERIFNECFRKDQALNEALAFRITGVVLKHLANDNVQKLVGDEDHLDNLPAVDKV